MTREDTMEIATKRGYTMKEACEYLGGVSRTTVYRLLGQGALTSYHLGVRHYFTKESLDRLIDHCIGLEPSASDTDTPTPDELREILKKGVLGE
jgi:excisionase family DNA binding protein